MRQQVPVEFVHPGEVKMESILGEFLGIYPSLPGGKRVVNFFHTSGFAEVTDLTVDVIDVACHGGVTRLREDGREGDAGAHSFMYVAQQL